LSIIIHIDLVRQLNIIVFFSFILFYYSMDFLNEAREREIELSYNIMHVPKRTKNKIERKTGLFAHCSCWVFINSTVCMTEQKVEPLSI